MFCVTFLDQRSVEGDWTVREYTKAWRRFDRLIRASGRIS